jgi:hypothetical protein
MPIEIKHRITGKTIYTSATATDLRMAVEEAVFYGARLYGASLNGASLYGASLNGASLNGVSLNGACLYGASLNGVSLNGASLNGASLYGASLNGASLNGASLNGASLNGASLYGARLNGACLDGARLNGAKGIFSFGPIGAEKRIGYAVAHFGGAMVKLGCFWGSEAAALAAISVKYGPESDYAAQVALACKIVMCGHIAATKTEAA